MFAQTDINDQEKRLMERGWMRLTGFVRQEIAFKKKLRMTHKECKTIFQNELSLREKLSLRLPE